ncbi:putative inner membrane protein [Anaerohalosphaera lusitana]|uniref:Putative inner membrane protein n=1 Tax=Anaerohalosphaera lusitana TaxID=1936003 RepID=A0A1U9NQ16_9BACT|nr:YeeE/YedE thiosulfate transporter family protein [Anaerohalosphaera lusitana]AQT69915.1 putative inner membrane protein [Anaerohalosphaera lusitana]
MSELEVRRAPLVWWIGGILLGLTQILAVALEKPLGVSTQFVVADSKVMHKVAPEYAQEHELISHEKYQKFGYGWWLDIGLIVGAFVAAVAIGRWRPRFTTVWWRATLNRGILSRLVTGFFGGFFILLGARIAHGCTSGQFASGWAQLSLSVIPFTIAMFVFGVFTAHLVYPGVPKIER